MLKYMLIVVDDFDVEYIDFKTYKQAKKMFSYYTSGEVARIAEVELIEYKTLCKERFEDA